mmetsp:Transcript_106675/g.183982  ORF Transcript_106675/g.183982 Transcript_106675/m.183982 type:complete len:282 (-) Transcript_106675:25-870(-)
MGICFMGVSDSHLGSEGINLGLQVLDAVGGHRSQHPFDISKLVGQQQLPWCRRIGKGLSLQPGLALRLLLRCPPVAFFTQAAPLLLCQTLCKRLGRWRALCVVPSIDGGSSEQLQRSERVQICCVVSEISVCSVLCDSLQVCISEDGFTEWRAVDAVMHQMILEDLAALCRRGAASHGLGVRPIHDGEQRRCLLTVKLVLPAESKCVEEELQEDVIFTTSIRISIICIQPRWRGPCKEFFQVDPHFCLLLQLCEGSHISGLQLVPQEGIRHCRRQPGLKLV